MALSMPRRAYSATILFFFLTEDKADGTLVGGVLQPVVHGVQIKIHLAGIFRLEGADLQINDDETAELKMVKQKIYVEITVADFHVNLTTDEGKADAEFHEKMLKVAEQAGFKFALMEGFFQREEIEKIGVFQKLGREV